MDDKNKINDNDLEQISGGQIFYAKGISGSDPDKPWEVVNEKGEVIDRADSKEYAIWLAGKHNVNFEEVDWKKLCEMRGQNTN